MKTEMENQRAAAGASPRSKWQPGSEQRLLVDTQPQKQTALTERCDFCSSGFLCLVEAFLPVLSERQKRTKYPENHSKSPFHLESNGFSTTN